MRSENIITTYTTLSDVWKNCAVTFNADADGTAIVIGSNLKKEPEVAPNTKSKLIERDGKLVAVYYKDGSKTGEKVIMPAITGVEPIQNTIIMRFADKTKTKATFDTDGEFSLEDGISICITKKLLGQEGSSLYNKLIEKALKVKAKNEADAAKAQQEAEEAKRRKAKYQAQREKKKQRRREEAVAIQAEAYARAMRMVAEENKK